MATAKKHMLRSHRSYGRKVDFSYFEMKARMRKANKENKGLVASLFPNLSKIFHRTTNK